MSRLARPTTSSVYNPNILHTVMGYIFYLLEAGIANEISSFKWRKIFTFLKNWIFSNWINNLTDHTQEQKISLQFDLLKTHILLSETKFKPSLRLFWAHYPHDLFLRCFNVMPTFKTMAQHWPSIGSTSGDGWMVMNGYGREWIDTILSFHYFSFYRI